MSILIHTCCALCLVGPNQLLVEEGHRVVALFFNPNVMPYREFRARLNAFKEYTTNRKIPALCDENYSLEPTLVRVDEAVKAAVKESDYDLIIRSDSVVYASDRCNITTQVIQRLDRMEKEKPADKTQSAAASPTSTPSGSPAMKEQPVLTPQTPQATPTPTPTPKPKPAGKNVFNAAYYISNNQREFYV